MGEQDSQIEMEKEEWFETTCRLMNKLVMQKQDDLVEFKLEEDEKEQLLAALEYYRGAVNPSSGDILVGTEFVCPGCGSEEEFRAQDGQVSMEAEHPEVGVEVARVHGIAQCSSCNLQVDLNQFRAMKLDDFDEDAWEDLYQEKYRGREKVEKLE